MNRTSILRLLLPAVAALAVQQSVAQATVPCISDAVNARFMQQYPSYAAAVQHQKDNWKKFVQMQSRARVINSSNGIQYEIPIVVHIIHTGGAVGTDRKSVV